MKISTAALPLLLAGALTGVAGCASAEEPAAQAPTATSAEPSAPGATAGATEEAAAGTDEESLITITDFEYEVAGPIPPGATVTVVNEDSAPHTVTAGDAGDFNAEVPAGETITFTAPDEPGEYEMICTYHPQMSGTLVIE
jgi:plastocyanin